MGVDETSPVSRGFVGRRRSPAQAERVPPGQYVTSDFPVLSAGPTPHTPLDGWSFALQHGTERIAEWSWSQFQGLNQTRVTADIHCVTKWSKLDTRWEGVTIDTLLEAAGLVAAPTSYVMAYSDGGYTTNLPIADLLKGRALVATKFDDTPLAPLTEGRRARRPAPVLLEKREMGAWIELHCAGQARFWESLGYHMCGDPWKEQRYAGD
jgi:DMSO/TMAO reductase YedYZ molybdopterin-dependent catalytic subunit